MAERIVSHAMLSYRDHEGRPRMALRGEKVQLEDDQLARAERLGAVVKEELDQPPVPAATAPRPPSDLGAPAVGLDSEQPVQGKPVEKPTRRASAKD